MKPWVAILCLGILICSCNKKHPRVLIETEMGDITIELYEDQAPVTSNNFIRYIREERYIGASFYRVVRPDNQPDSKVKIEVVQGGLYEDDHPQALPPIPHENTAMTGIFHKDGVISMARNGPGTATFEFFICLGDQPSLDYGGERNPDHQGFAAFGQVVDGMDVIRKIQQQPAKDQYLQVRIPIRNMRLLY